MDVPWPSSDRHLPLPHTPPRPLPLTHGRTKQNRTLSRHCAPLHSRGGGNPSGVEGGPRTLPPSVIAPPPVIASPAKQSGGAGQRALHCENLSLPTTFGFVFPYFQTFGPFLALEVDITLETIPLLRHDAAPPLNVISRLTTVFTTPKKRLMSSSQPSPGPPPTPPRLPACPSASLCATLFMPKAMTETSTRRATAQRVRHGGSGRPGARGISLPSRRLNGTSAK